MLSTATWATPGVTVISVPLNETSVYASGITLESIAPRMSKIAFCDAFCTRCSTRTLKSFRKTSKAYTLPVTMNLAGFFLLCVVLRVVSCREES